MLEKKTARDIFLTLSFVFFILNKNKGQTIPHPLNEQKITSSGACTSPSDIYFFLLFFFPRKNIYLIHFFFFCFSILPLSFSNDLSLLFTNFYTIDFYHHNQLVTLFFRKKRFIGIKFWTVRYELLMG